MTRVATNTFFQNVAFANTCIICIISIRKRMQIHILYVFYVCKYAYYTYPYPDREYAGSNPKYNRPVYTTN
jgi:hypothetical protein